MLRAQPVDVQLVELAATARVPPVREQTVAHDAVQARAHRTRHLVVRRQQHHHCVVTAGERVGVTPELEPARQAVHVPSIQRPRSPLIPLPRALQQLDIRRGVAHHSASVVSTASA